MDEKQDCPECGHPVAATLAADLRQADTATLSRLRDLADSLSGLPLILLGSTLPPLFLVVIPLFSPWTLWGIPAISIPICLWLYALSGTKLVRELRAFLPTPDPTGEFRLGPGALLSVAIGICILAVATSHWILALVALLAGLSTLLVTWVLDSVRRLSERLQRKELIKLTRFAVWFGWSCTGLVSLAVLLFVPVARPLTAAPMGWLGSPRGVMILVLLVLASCLWMWGILASLVMFRLRRVFDELVAGVKKSNGDQESSQ